MTELSIILSFVGSLTAVISLVLSISNMKKAKNQIIYEYFTEIGSKEFIAAKKEVYHTDFSDVTTNIDNENAAMLINFFDRWGYLVKKKYLSSTLFKDTSGVPIQQLYEIMSPVIIKRREKNKGYAHYFEWLYNEIKNYNVTGETHNRDIQGRYDGET